MSKKTIPQSSPLFLHQSDNPGIMLTQTIFNGENYDNWVEAVRVGLDSKNKLAFIDGGVDEPEQGDEDEGIEHVAWRQCNAMIKAWLRNVINEKLHSSISFSATVTEIWTELKERYAAGNAPRVHQLKAELNDLKQGNFSVVEYYTKLKVIWDELANYTKVPKCTCGAAAAYQKEKEEERAHQFLMGLNDATYGTLRSNILMEEPLPSMSKIYGIVLREERHKAIMRSKEERSSEAAFAARRGSASTSGGRQPWPSRYNNNVVDEAENRCTYCTKWGHTEDDCWSKNGVPPHVGRGRGRGRVGRGGGRFAGRGDGRAQRPNQTAHAVGTIGQATGGESKDTAIEAANMGLTRDEILSLRTLLKPGKDDVELSSGPFDEEDDWGR